MRTIALTLFMILSSFYSFSAVVDTVSIYSTAMRKDIKNVIIKPDRMAEDMPSLFLLHGAGDDYAGWVNRVPLIKDLADQYGTVIICPDGGRTSWYFDSPLDSAMQYETYITKELNDWVGDNLPVSANREKRAIAGLSMGGHGAFYLAMNHPELWGMIGSMSGGVDFRSFPDSWDIKKRIGTKEEYPENWESMTVFNRTQALKDNPYRIIFDCGIKDFFYPMNKALHEKLLYEEIDHDYTERPGAHSWKYWSNSIKYQMLYFFSEIK